MLFGDQQKYLKYQLEKVRKKELPNQDVLDDTPFLVWGWGWGNKGSDVENKTTHCLLYSVISLLGSDKFYNQNLAQTMGYLQVGSVLII